MKITILAATLLLAASLSTFRAQDAPPYRDPYTGEAQPEFCNNAHTNSHPCECHKTNDQCEVHTAKKCLVFCREKDCHCVDTCGS